MGSVSQAIASSASQLGVHIFTEKVSSVLKNVFFTSRCSYFTEITRVSWAERKIEEFYLVVHNVKLIYGSVEH